MAPAKWQNVTVKPMTQTGHLLTGAAIGVLCLPANASTKQTGAHLLTFMLLANVPDLPWPYWGHDQYRVSHSLFVNLVLILLAVLLLAALRRVRIRIGNWSVVVGGIAAWLSHLLLDSFYNHGQGVAIFWPLSPARLALPIPWFSVVTSSPPPITPEMVRIVLIEFVAYFPLLMLAIGIKTGFLRRLLRYLVPERPGAS